MGFVNEFVPEDQKDNFDPEVFNLGPAYPPARPYRWVIDREQDVFLISTGRSGSGGGQGDGYIPPVFFTFSIHKKLVKFEAKITAVESEGGGWTINWVIENLNISSVLKSKQEEVLQLLKDAIDVHGSSTGKRDDGETTINITIK